MTDPTTSATPQLQVVPREDDRCDVVRKAMLGHGLTPESLASRCPLPLDTILETLKESPRSLADNIWNTIAQAIDLDPASLIRLPSYQPDIPLLTGLSQIITPFGHAGANSFLLHHNGTTILFDAGTSATPIVQHLKENALTLDAIYITHRHHDHIGGLTAFPDTPTYFAEDLKHGQIRQLTQRLHLTALETSGHFTPSLAYLIDGFEVPVCICGDILFAGSMGKTPDPQHFQQSLDHAKQHLLSLSPETILCPGHGPVTTVRQEQKNNPFFSLPIDANHC